jgi:predicted pyridoxine 5'-phosphate oxidase superfamily flavin-nucleotide-binding protein
MTMMNERPFYHEGMRRLQDRYDGRRVADALNKHRTHYAFWPDEEEMIRQAPFFFIASASGEFVDCNIKSGDPGFVKITGPATLEYPEYDGNSMYRTLGNISESANIALLFVRFDGKSRRIRVNGKATICDDAETLSRHFGAKLVVRIECEIYPNCPRYLPNLEEKAASAHPPREGLPPPPPPEWKRRDMIRDILPADDPHIDAVKSRGPLE